VIIEVDTSGKRDLACTGVECPDWLRIAQIRIECVYKILCGGDNYDSDHRLSWNGHIQWLRVDASVHRIFPQLPTIRAPHTRMIEHRLHSIRAGSLRVIMVG